MNTVITKQNFEVPRELLFRAWTEPEHLKNWWGPHGFTNTFYEFDLRPGGYWRFTMHGPDGKNYENESIFETIIPAERIIFEHISPPAFRTDVCFTGMEPGGTSLEWKMIFKEEQLFQSLEKFIIEKNKENLERLQAELEKMKST